jgi:hypothetical protein
MATGFSTATILAIGLAMPISIPHRRAAGKAHYSGSAMRNSKTWLSSRSSSPRAMPIDKSLNVSRAVWPGFTSRMAMIVFGASDWPGSDSLWAGGDRQAFAVRRLTF